MPGEIDYNEGLPAEKPVDQNEVDNPTEEPVDTGLSGGRDNLEDAPNNQSENNIESDQSLNREIPLDYSDLPVNQPLTSQRDTDAKDDDAPFAAEAQRIQQEITRSSDNHNDVSRDRDDTQVDGHEDRTDNAETSRDQQGFEKTGSESADAINDQEYNPSDIDFSEIESYASLNQNDSSEDTVERSDDIGIRDDDIGSSITDNISNNDDQTDLPSDVIDNADEIEQGGTGDSSDSAEIVSDVFSTPAVVPQFEPPLNDSDIKNDIETTPSGAKIESGPFVSDTVGELVTDTNHNDDSGPLQVVDDDDTSKLNDTEQSAPETDKEAVFVSDNENSEGSGNSQESNEQPQIVAEGDPVEIGSATISDAVDNSPVKQESTDNAQPLDTGVVDEPVLTDQVPDQILNENSSSIDTTDRVGSADDSKSEAGNGSSLSDTIKATVIDSIQGINDNDISQNYENLQSMFADTDTPCTNELFAEEVGKVLDECESQLNTGDSTIELPQDGYDAMTNDLNQFMELNGLGDVDIDQNLVDTDFDTGMDAGIESDNDDDVEIDSDPIGVEDLKNDW